MRTVKKEAGRSCSDALIAWRRSSLNGVRKLQILWKHPLKRHFVFKRRYRQRTPSIKVRTLWMKFEWDKIKLCNCWSNTCVSNKLNWRWKANRWWRSSWWYFWTRILRHSKAARHESWIRLILHRTYHWKRYQMSVLINCSRAW